VGVGAIIAIVAGVVLVVVLAVLVVLTGRRPAPGPCGGCGRAMLPSWSRCMFCGWQPVAAVPRLEFLAGPLKGQVVPLGEEVTTIGSVEGNTVVLADPAVSRKHVGIRRVGNHFELADLGSTNGVYVNGQRMAKKTLVAGDLMRVGTTELVFRAG
jgi:hypothetical protein